MKLFRWTCALIRGSIANSIVIFVIVAAFAGWMAFVYLNNDGVITGVVVDGSGHPVSNARVLVREKTLQLIKPPIGTDTNSKGVYRFKDMKIIEFLISARKDGYKSPEPVHYHLYFKGQHFKVPKPLVLTKE
ncbi:MAG TPA: carboxypeptidase-like regulatory domain-containing protein [Spirochaetia bacterium]|nr:carboxypeptidase-like regulatory domain-containing protein [Spirochaetia bacterium]